MPVLSIVWLKGPIELGTACFEKILVVGTALVPPARMNCWRDEQCC